ncbi:uncharacterized protein VTP21DRAFT_8432 [Calcarisporiella thermophila]|uniref:uncharacterized protein n=1 Tax=Calcarisporiella thermophila TaxID=911321 RepID=UPI00374483CB
MSGVPDKDKIAAMIAQKKAELTARLAQSGLGTKPATPPPAPAPQPTRPELSIPAGVNPDEIRRKLQEARSIAKTLAGSAAANNEPRAKGGLQVEAHPLLMRDETGNLKFNSSKVAIPKPVFATTKANLRVAPKKQKEEVKPKPVEPVKNPYLEASTEVEPGAVRRTRKFKFVQPGKYVKQAEQIRQKAHMEELKEKIAANVNKIGLEAEISISDKAIKKEPPPAIEWWDAFLLPNKTYDDIDNGQAKIDTDDSIITHLVQHPVVIPPPDSGTAPAKMLMLTKKERKKLRRQKRMEILKEKQDKIRLGLLPPDPPKVKLSNLMRVLGNDAIQDPTKIEARVRKEMEKRHALHMKMNQERKLTPEQLREKKRRKLEEDTSQMVHVNVYKIRDLSHPSHRFKVDKNAQQLNFTGIVLLNNKFNLVVVEGGPKNLNRYQKLMLRRIKWNDQAYDEEEEEEDDQSNNTTSNAMNVDKNGPNRCDLVWEGQLRERLFRQFRFRQVPTEGQARELLRKYQAEQYWDLAENFKREDEMF